MIKIYKYYPIIILEINTLNNLSFKDLTEYINFIINYSLENEIYINIYVDLFDFKEYSFYYITKLIYFNNSIELYKLKFLNKIHLFVNINDKNFITENINYLQNICPIKIELHYINKKKMWDNLFKE